MVIQVVALIIGPMSLLHPCHWNDCVPEVSFALQQHLYCVDSQAWQYFLTHVTQSKHRYTRMHNTTPCFSMVCSHVCLVLLMLTPWWHHFRFTCHLFGEHWSFVDSSHKGSMMRKLDVFVTVSLYNTLVVSSDYTGPICNVTVKTIMKQFIYERNP